jgi:hypothetical protein
MPNFSRIIERAYLRILDRPPDPGGLETYNRAMNDGLSEAAMRESLLRSPEYATKNPDLSVRAGRGAARAGTVGGRRRKVPKKR